MSYADLLKDPMWQKRRLEVLEDAQWKCEECDDKTTELHVHHKRYLRNLKPWEYERADLIVLCRPHHDLWHRNMDILMLAVSRMISMAGFENAVGYALMVAAMGSEDFAKFRLDLDGCIVGGILSAIDMRGVIGLEFVKSRVSEDGTIDLCGLLSDVAGAKFEESERRKELLEDVILNVRELGEG